MFNLVVLQTVWGVMAIKVFRNYWKRPMAVLAGMELLVFASALCLVSLPHFDGESPLVERDISEVLVRAVLFAPLLSIAMAATGLYNERQSLTLGGLITRILVSSLGGMAVIAIVAGLVPELGFSREALLMGLVLVSAGSAGCHYILAKLAGEQVFKKRIVVYGAGRRAASLIQKQADGVLGGFKVVGFIPAMGDDTSVVTIDRRIDMPSNFLEYCQGHGVTELVVALDDTSAESTGNFPFKAFMECRLAGIETTDLTEYLERETGQVRIDLVQPNWMVSEGFTRNSVHASLERMFDVMASLVLLALSWPLMLITVIAIKLEEGPTASVLYRQVRVGEHGQPFRLFKFRSMREDAERDGRARWAAKNDDRVTRVGRIIRRLRIDELPQIINVLNGEMSLVGPRPERPEFVSQLNTKIPLYGERHVIKPGLTGWAQLCYPYGSSDTDAAEKLQYDLFYVKNRTLLFYLAILIQTVEVVLWGKGVR
jgi:sugar transferase (PEP-CTERM system associated)